MPVTCEGEIVMVPPMEPVIVVPLMRESERLPVAGVVPVNTTAPVAPFTDVTPMVIVPPRITVDPVTASVSPDTLLDPVFYHERGKTEQ